MDAFSVQHLNYLAQLYPELGGEIVWNNHFELREVPPFRLNPFSRGRLHRIHFDAELRIQFWCVKKPVVVSFFIDENLRYDSTDRHGDSFEEKTRLLDVNDDILHRWCYFHINGNEAYEVAFSRHWELPRAGILDDLLRELHFWYQNNSLIG